MTTRRRMIGGWTVRPIGDLVACPASLRERTFDLGEAGCVHEALIAAKAIPHPDAPGGEEAQEWIGRTDWCFAAWVRIDRRLLQAGRLDLVFDHIDTLGDVLVNGVRVVAVANEFVPVRTPVRAFLREGLNEIEVRLRGPVSAVESLERRLGSRPVNGDWTPFSFLRKSACNFGWDWGPRVATAGIGRASIEAWDGARIESVRPLVMRCDETAAAIRVAVTVERTDDEPLDLRVELVAPDGQTLDAVTPIEGEASGVELTVARPHRWWPRGHGDQPLYRVAATVERGGESIDRVERRIGLRTVRLDTSDDADGSRFTVLVNEQPVWCRGANWIPVSLFPRSEPAERTERWIDAACDAGLVMLRVWGGGLYEREEFYDRCDERGMLVWQDFMFACATYPEESPYPALVEAEARHQVARLASHPCVALWCGGNEDILAWWSWGWRDRLRDGQSWGKRYWLELLPAVVAELDPTRPYWPESPYSGTMDVHPNEPSRGDRHTWDAKLEQYRTIVPRFCSEFGHQSPPSLGTIRESFGDRIIEIGDEELARRQRAWGGDAFQYAPLLAEHFPPLRTIDEWIVAAQLLQARAYAIAIEWMRANAPRCMGALFWQWNDVWTGHSWSVWDIAGRPKPSFFAVRRACASRCLSLVPDGEGLRVVLSVAAGEATLVPTTVRLRLVGYDGTEHAADEVLCTPAAEDPWTASALVPHALANPREPARAMLLADAVIAPIEGEAASGIRDVGGAMPYEGGRLRATHRFVRDREAAFVPGAWRVRAIDGHRFELSADSPLVELCVLPEYAGSRATRASDGWWTLLPGERVRVNLIGAPMSEREVHDAVRLANALGR